VKIRNCLSAAFSLEKKHKNMGETKVRKALCLGKMKTLPSSVRTSFHLSNTVVIISFFKSGSLPRLLDSEF